jgi:hypothetical protein
VQYAVKNLAKGKRTPQNYHMKNLKLLTRYLRGRPTAGYVYELENVPAFIDTNVDSDWAGEKPGRRSTSGGGVCLGNAVIQSHSRTQATVSLSSAERETNAIVSEAVEGKWVRSLMG